MTLDPSVVVFPCGLIGLAGILLGVIGRGRVAYIAAICLAGSAPLLGLIGAVTIDAWNQGFP